MINMKNIIENFKDPKKRAIYQLVLYGIFFLVVFVLIRVGGSGYEYADYSYDEEKTTVVDSEVKSYSYRISFDDNTIEGIYYDKTSTFTYNFTNYYLEDNSIYVIDRISVMYLSFCESLFLFLLFVFFSWMIHSLLFTDFAAFLCVLLAIVFPSLWYIVLFSLLSMWIPQVISNIIDDVSAPLTLFVSVLTIFWWFR